MPTRLPLALTLAALLAAPAAHAQQPPPDPNTLHARATPSWLGDAIVYEVFPRAFSPQGTLAGVTAQLPRLQALGVNTLWLMPIHPIGQTKRLGTLGSPYAAQDFYAIDPALGTKADLTALVTQAHALHMRVILDIAADHTSWDSALMHAHPDYFTHDAQGHIVSPHGWSDVAGLDYSNPATVKYMTEMFSYWLQTFHLDGFRCDAAAYVPTPFWNQLRPVLQRIDPDVLLLAEASKPELMTEAFDLDYGWPLLATFNRIFTQGAPASAVEATLHEQAHLFPADTEHLLISDDHDEQRAVTRWGTPAAFAASTLVFTLPGVPLLYNGQEVADATPSGAPALFERLPIPWSVDNHSATAFYTALLALHAHSPALLHGELTWLHNSDEAHVITFLRHDPTQSVLVTVNLSSTPFRGTVEAPTASWTEVTLNPSPRRHSEATTPPPQSLPALSLEPYAARIFTSK